MTNTQCLMIDPTNARQSRGIWARAVARRVLEPRLGDVAPVQVTDVAAAPTAHAPRLEEMYAELALKTAGLLEQQHALLDSLERDETEPGRLDQLFAIDHLIAQARRHADSLRLLTDGSAGRPRTELTVDDVLHAAASSVQDYPRVRIEVTVAQQVSAGASADVVHLVTETLDRALAASTDSVVVVTTAREGEALRIEVLHEGASQDARQSTSTHLVDLLAQRHGVRVDVRTEPDGASVDSIVVPASALVEPPQTTGLRGEAPDLDEWRAPVLPLAPPAAPRHRREDAVEGMARRSG
jgi:hypothetical protein